MTTRLAAYATDDADLLALVADPYTPLAQDLADRFRAACWAEAQANGGLVHPCAVTARIKAEDPDANMRRVAALWSVATGRDGYLDNTDLPARIDGAVSKGNGNKVTTYRRWRGWVA